MCAAAPQRLPHVGALARAGLADALRDPRHVRRGMRRLHRGDDVERGEPRDVAGAQDLRMLVAHAQRAAARHLALQLLEQVQDGGVGAIADRVDAGLVAGAHGGQRLRVQIGRGRHQQAARAGFVAVRLVQRRAARPERAVGDELHGAHREQMAGVAERPAAAASRRSAAAAASRTAASSACRRRPPRGTSPTSSQATPASCTIVSPSLAATSSARRNCARRAADVGWRDVARHQAHRRVDEHAGRRAVAGCGSRVRRQDRRPWRVTPAARSAAVFTHAAWPSTRDRYTG